MYLLNDAFSHRSLFLYQFADEVKGFFVADCLQMIFKRLLTNGQPSQNQIGFAKGQRITFNRIGIVRIFYNKLFPKSFNFALCQ